ncbi:MAG: hypothetical protein QXH18_03935 [Candidatus Micrarchaeia archaeon]
MAEREEKIIKKGEKKEEKKPSLWQRMKKPLAAGLLGASLLFSPAKKADAVGFAEARDPPLYAAEVIEKDKDLKVGWKFLIKAYENAIGKNNIGSELAIKYLDAATNIFKKAYEKTGSIDALYLQAYTIYAMGGPESTFEKTEERCKEALEIIEKRLKEEPNDLDFNSLKLQIYYNLAQMYYEGYTKDPAYLRAGRIDLSKLDSYKEKSIGYADLFNKYFSDVEKRVDELEIYAFKKDSKENSNEISEIRKAFIKYHKKQQLWLQNILYRLKR